jgi:hypothetical protein
MDTKETKNPQKDIPDDKFPFTLESLKTYKGNVLYNVNFLAAGFMYDFPRIASNPKELYQIIKRYKQGKPTKRDRIIVEILIDRLSEFNETKEIVKLLQP